MRHSHKNNNQEEALSAMDKKDIIGVEKALLEAIMACEKNLPSNYSISVEADAKKWTFQFTPRGAILGGGAAVEVNRKTGRVMHIVHFQ
jgi:hypothetical protein